MTGVTARVAVLQQDRIEFRSGELIVGHGEEFDYAAEDSRRRRNRAVFCLSGCGAPELEHKLDYGPSCGVAFMACSASLRRGACERYLGWDAEIILQNARQC